MDALTASLRTSHGSLVPSSRSHNSASSSSLSVTRCRPSSSRTTLPVLLSRRRVHHASSDASFSPAASVVYGGSIDVTRRCIVRRAGRPSGRGRRDVVIPRASSSGGDDPEAASSSYETSKSLPASIADSRWFNTYIHGAVFVFILGKVIGYVSCI